MPTQNTEDFFKNAFSALTLDASRIILLKSIANYIAQDIEQNKPVNLNFICTHNSRRSQLAQVWGSYAANYFKFNQVNCFSGGTEATGFFKNTVATLKEVGFSFQITTNSETNPVYAINYKNGINPITGFSKLYNHPQNTSPFIAITTCSSADENCPFIAEAKQRFHLPFVDPKSADNTAQQDESYLKANKQIAGEIHFIFKTISELV